MARSPKPWYREDRQSWFVTIKGVRHNLGPDKHEAERLFHQLMAAPEAPQATGAQNPGAPPGPVDLGVAELLDKYLDWCQRHRASRTYEWYLAILQSFARSLPDASMPAGDLRPFHVVEWSDSQTTWSPTSRRQAIVAVQRAYNWAEDMGHLDRSPIKKVAKPTPERRDNHVTAEEFAAILGHVPDQQFRDLLNFAWHTGCRPQEARHVEARHVDLGGSRIVIPKEEAKGRRRARIIHLGEEVLEIVRRLLPACREGKLFLNVDGNPWKKSAVCCRFYRLKKKLGKKYAAYDLRHGFCQRMLENGADHLAVAELMGHSNGQMVAQTYSHMNKADAHLKETLRKAATPDATGPGASA